MASWNTIKEAVRALKGQMSKNERNAAKYRKKKERGPVKAFFHITKNENVPAIEQQGLLTNHPNANINSANHPFRKHGTDAGGVWVTTEPTAFPVYGTTIGGKNGNASARADALSTIKIEVPLPELRKMKAVQDPYGKNILRRGDDPRAIEKFGTWAGNEVPTTVLLNDVKPQWLKNIGYLEETAINDANRDIRIADYLEEDGSWANIARDVPTIFGMNKADFRALSGMTGHRGPLEVEYDVNKSPARFVHEQMDKNRPITERLPTFPKPEGIGPMANKQTGHSPNYIFNENDELASVPANELKRYSVDVIPANKWTTEYKDYIKPGESVNKQRTHEFAPGAISRGIGGSRMPSVKDRAFNWNKYKQAIAASYNPGAAAMRARPPIVLDWDHIVYRDGQYLPRMIVSPSVQYGSISQGNSITNATLMRAEQRVRRSDADRLRQAIKPFTDSNADIVRNEYKITMPDDEIRELSRLEMRNNKDNVKFNDVVKSWSRLENSDILKLRQRALDKIEGSWLYDYLTK